MIFAQFLAILAAASAQPSPATENKVSAADAANFIARCGERKFRASAQTGHQGKMRKVNLVLCAKPADTNADWIATLEKATVDVMNSGQLNPAAKEKLISELNAEIARLRAAAE